MSQANKIGWLLSGLFFMVFSAYTIQSHANGGQVQQNRPIIDPDTGEVIGIVVPVNACENYETVKDQSGKVLYVICLDGSD